MQTEDYTGGDAFQREKRTVFSTEWLPACAEAQLAGPGDFVAVSVGGWGVVAVRDKEATLRVLRNACRHQNMSVVALPAGRCEHFRCRFHGWTYDLQGRFGGAPKPVAPADPASPDNDMRVLTAECRSGIVFFSLAPQALPPPALAEAPPAYGGTITTEIACNWKVCAEHLMSGDVAWHWPLLGLRAEQGGVMVVEQVVPHTFLRTRLVTHAFGAAVDTRREQVEAFKQACERLQFDRNAGVMATGDSGLAATFHRQLADAYARDIASTPS
jgi:phenylpropionate dioxygenase-like ring-hydroxylating dioxygenase large terminal subunit